MKRILFYILIFLSLSGYFLTARAEGLRAITLNDCMTMAVEWNVNVSASFIMLLYNQTASTTLPTSIPRIKWRGSSVLRGRST